MGKVTIRIKDEIYARMLILVLCEHGYEVMSGDDCDGNEEFIISDIESFPEVSKKNKNVILVDYGESPYKNIPFFKRPADVNEIVKTAIGFSGTEKKEDGDIFILNKKKHTVTFGKKTVFLTDTEYRLFAVLYEKRSQVVTTEEIKEKIWKDGGEKQTNAPAVYINFLRKKFDETFDRRMILSVRGKGYMLR